MYVGVYTGVDSTDVSAPWRDGHHHWLSMFGPDHDTDYHYDNYQGNQPRYQPSHRIAAKGWRETIKKCLNESAAQNENLTQLAVYACTLLRLDIIVIFFPDKLLYNKYQYVFMSTYLSI